MQQEAEARTKRSMGAVRESGTGESTLAGSADGLMTFGKGAELTAIPVNAIAQASIENIEGWMMLHLPSCFRQSAWWMRTISYTIKSAHRAHWRIYVCLPLWQVPQKPFEWQSLKGLQRDLKEVSYLQDAVKATIKEKRSLRFQEEEPEAHKKVVGEVSKQAVRKKLPRRHTGYAFDHPGFESFHANEARLHLQKASKVPWQWLITIIRKALVLRRGHCKVLNSFRGFGSASNLLIVLHQQVQICRVDCIVREDAHHQSVSPNSEVCILLPAILLPLFLKLGCLLWRTESCWSHQFDVPVSCEHAISSTRLSAGTEEARQGQTWHWDCCCQRFPSCCHTSSGSCARQKAGASEALQCHWSYANSCSSCCS